VFWRARSPWRSQAAGWGEQVLDADAVVELGADPVGDRGDDFASVPAGVDVGAKRALCGGQVDDPCDLGRDVRCVGLGWDQCGEPLAEFRAQSPERRVPYCSS
jgi:hypothetical protein